MNFFASRPWPSALVSAAAVLASFVSYTAPEARASLYVWDGGGGDNNWSTAGNWNPDGAPVSDRLSTDLQFAGSNRLTAVAQAPYSLRSLTFNSGAGAFTLSGSALSIGVGGITNNSANTQTINNAVTVGLDQSWSFGNGAGGLNVASVSVTKSLGLANGTVNIGSGSNFNIDDSTSSGAAIVNLAGATVSSGDVTLGFAGTGAFNHSAGNMTVNPSNLLYLGRSAGSSGSYNLSGTGQLSTGAVRIGDTGSGTFIQSGGSFTTNGNLLTVGLNSGANGTYTLSGGSLSPGTVRVGSSGTGTFSQSGGTLNSNAGVLILGVNASGKGTYTLSGGSVSAAATRISSGTSSFTQTGGTHTTGTLGMGDFADANVAYNLDGGTLAANNVTRSTGTATFNFNGGTLQARQNNTSFFQNLSTANVRDGGAVIDTNGFNVTAAQAVTHSNLPGDNATDGGLTKTGSGTLTLTSVNTYNGGTTVTGGTLSVSSDANLGAANGAVTLQNSAQLVFTTGFITSRTYNLNTSTMNFMGSLLQGATVNGGYLAGNSVLDAATFNNVTTLPASTLTVNPTGATLNNTAIRGSLNATAPFTNIAFNNGFVTGSGTLTVGFGNVQAPVTLNTTGTEIQGVTTVVVGGTIANSGNNLYLSGGSRTTINTGGTLSTTTGTTIELNSSLLVNNGAQSGVLNVNYGSLAKGAGTFGTVNVNDGGRFSPGNSPGTATLGNLSLGSGGRYEFELNSAHASPGNGADFMNVLGQLELAAGTSGNSVLTIAIISLNSLNQPAALTDFDASQPYTFTLATAAGGISGFSPNEFRVDATGFANNLQGGSFVVAQNGNSLELQFHPVPEPSTWAMIVFGISLLLTVQRRRKI